MKSVLIKSQFKTFSKKINYEGTDCTMSVTLRYDDKCNNGHNTFSITGSIKGGEYGRYGYNISMAGCIHDEIKKYFPEFAHLIKWHLCNSDAPILSDIKEYSELPTNVCLTDCPEYSIGEGCSQNCFENRLKIILDIINKAKGGE